MQATLLPVQLMLYKTCTLHQEPLSLLSLPRLPRAPAQPQKRTGMLPGTVLHERGDRHTLDAVSPAHHLRTVFSLDALLLIGRLHVDVYPNTPQSCIKNPQSFCNPATMQWC